MFGQSDFDPSNVYEATPFEEQLAALQELVDAGKVRHIGVSNETPYGVCSMIALHEAFPEKYPRISSIQNSYSLVVRKDYEAGLSEACHAHNVALLPYSPLASGTLSGKYANPAKIPENARLTKFPGKYTHHVSILLIS
jgi:aryl-alcohol dehydrogenase-like predicted oxidoreductase